MQPGSRLWVCRAGAILFSLASVPAMGDDGPPETRGQLSAEEERMLQQLARNWRRNGQSELAQEIEEGLARERELEAYQEGLRAWEEARRREWEKKHGTRFLEHPAAPPEGERPQDPPAPDPDGSSATPNPDGGGIPSGGDSGSAWPPYLPPNPVGGGPTRWIEYSGEDGRGGNDVGGIGNLLRGR